jgi:hypothetical protein
VGTVALELAHHGARVQVVAAGQAQQLGQHTEMDAVLGMAVHHGVHGAVDVQQQAIVPAPLGQARVGAPAAGDVVVHDDRGADLLGVLGPLVHLLGRRSRHVQVVALALAGLLLGLVDGLHDEVEALAPVHEGL